MLGGIATIHHIGVGNAYLSTLLPAAVVVTGLFAGFRLNSFLTSFLSFHYYARPFFFYFCIWASQSLLGRFAFWRPSPYVA